MEIKVGVGIMLKQGEKILLGYRNPKVDKGATELKGQGTWSMPGGKVEFHEKLEDAAKRELKEETGLEMLTSSIISIQDDFTETAHYITVCFIAESLTGELCVMEPDQISKWEWFSLNELPENLYQASKQAIENYQKGLLY